MTENLNISLRMLRKVLSIQSHSNRTGSDEDINMRNYVKSVLSSNNICFWEDKYGNIYAHKGESETYPCIVSHMDTVHSHIKDFTIKKLDEYLYAFNNISIKQTGIGGDDKVGIYLTLQFILDNDIVKAVFYRNEEIGKLGSNFSIKNHKDFYKNCRYVIEPDRKGNSDFITYSGGIKMCSDKFINDSKEIFQKYGYSDERGIATDVDILVKNHIGISCVNLSCGYYRPHMDSEVVSIYDVDDVYNMINDLVINLEKEQYKFKHVEKSYNTSSNYRYPFNKDNKNDIYKPVKAAVYRVPIDLYKSDPESLFSPIKGGNNMYVYTGESIVNTYVKCPICDTLNTVYYLPDEDEFFCTSKKCNDFIHNQSGLKHINYYFYLKDYKDNKYRHMTHIDHWIPDKKAQWNERAGTYIPMSKK